jgi:hypothetical protein
MIAMSTALDDAAVDEAADRIDAAIADVAQAFF